jgi:hypothetical protein
VLFFIARIHPFELSLRGAESVNNGPTEGDKGEEECRGLSDCSGTATICNLGNRVFALQNTCDTSFSTAKFNVAALQDTNVSRCNRVDTNVADLKTTTVTRCNRVDDNVATLQTIADSILKDIYKRDYVIVTRLGHFFERICQLMT